MKKFFVFILISLSINAQTLAQIEFDQAGLGLSYWIRSYTTPDEQVLLTNPPAGNGSSNPVLVPHLFARLKLGNYFGVKGRVGFAQDSYESSLLLGTVLRTEKIDQTILPLGLMLDFEIPMNLKSKSGDEEKDGDSDSKSSVKSADSPFKLVGGLGINRYYIQHTFSRIVVGGEGSLADAKFSGNDFGLSAMLGIAYKVSSKLVLTGFSQYNTGSYQHRLYSETELDAFESKTISLQGLEFGIYLGYRLGK